MRANIQLWDSVGLGVIIERPTRITYSNQTGGASCLHPVLEGVYIPLRNDILLADGTLLSPANELYDYFAGPKHRGCGAIRGLDAGDANYIDAVLAKWRLGSIVVVDRDRLRESQEAWVRVLVLREEQTEPDLRIFRGLGPYPAPAVLTWPNTD